MHFQVDLFHHGNELFYVAIYVGYFADGPKGKGPSIEI